tara:strand:+ start:193 stop:339 length:147 start_codon:yes stop_codon:yes gene_type:complete
VLTEFVVTETYKVKAKTIDQVQKAISEDDFSEVETNLDERKVTVEPNF